MKDTYPAVLVEKVLDPLWEIMRMFDPESADQAERTTNDHLLAAVEQIIHSLGAPKDVDEVILAMLWADATPSEYLYREGLVIPMELTELGEGYEVTDASCRTALANYRLYEPALIDYLTANLWAWQVLRESETMRDSIHRIVEIIERDFRSRDFTSMEGSAQPHIEIPLIRAWLDKHSEL
jgi:hypothetical protein